MSAVDIVTVRLTWAEDVQVGPSAQLLRGAIAECFPDNPLFHQHEGDRVLYRYPAIQYRWDGEGAVVVGFSGTLLANVDLPDGFAFGRAVSHGHGWLFRVSPPLREERRP